MTTNFKLTSYDFEKYMGIFHNALRFGELATDQNQNKQFTKKRVGREAAGRVLDASLAKGFPCNIYIVSFNGYI